MDRQLIRQWRISQGARLCRIYLPDRSFNGQWCPPLFKRISYKFTNGKCEGCLKMKFISFAVEVAGVKVYPWCPQCNKYTEECPHGEELRKEYGDALGDIDITEDIVDKFETKENKEEAKKIVEENKKVEEDIQCVELKLEATKEEIVQLEFQLDSSRRRKKAKRGRKKCTNSSLNKTSDS